MPLKMSRYIHNNQLGICSYITINRANNKQSIFLLSLSFLLKTESLYQRYLLKISTTTVKLVTVILTLSTSVDLIAGLFTRPTFQPWDLVLVAGIGIGAVLLVSYLIKTHNANTVCPVATRENTWTANTT